MKNNKLVITSDAFKDGGNIPSKYTCDGKGVNPPFKVDDIPEGTKTLALIAEDPDAPGGTFDHWLVWNLPIDSIIEEDRMPGMSGRNGRGKTGYHPPCPPSGSHRYFFHIYALDTSLDISEGSDKKTLQNAIKGHVLAEGTLMGVYSKVKSSL